MILIWDLLGLDLGIVCLDLGLVDFDSGLVGLVNIFGERLWSTTW